MSPDHRAEQLRSLLRARVGAFFTNTARGPGFCTVCTAPAAAELCARCAGQRATYGESLADLVVPLAYVRGRMRPPHQSEHYVWRYKHPVRPSPRCLQDLSLVMLAGTLLHGPCIGSWDVVTFVPSASRPGPEHPVAELARQAAAHSHGVQRILLRPGPGLTSEPLRAPRDDRFTVAPEHLPVIAGRHVLVVDDTWVSGSKAQSAAVGLKLLGADRITIICVGRWLSDRWEEHRPLIASPHEPYDALRCPVTGGTCPAG